MPPTARSTTATPRASSAASSVRKREQPRSSSCHASERENKMHITRNSIDTNAGPSAWFTGDVYVDPVATPSEQSRLSASSVHFTPGARTAWHTHPNGQTIYVIERENDQPPRTLSHLCKDLLEPRELGVPPHNRRADQMRHAEIIPGGRACRTGP